MTALKVGWLVLVSVGAVSLSRVLMGADGTWGALLGAGLGVVLCLVNFFIAGGSFRSGAGEPDGRSVKLVVVGVIVSFWLLISFILLVNYLVPPLVKPAALTALAVYLAYRGAEVLSLARPRGGRSSRLSVVSGGARLSMSGLTGTADAESGKET